MPSYSNVRLASEFKALFKFSELSSWGFFALFEGIKVLVIWAIYELCNSSSMYLVDFLHLWGPFVGLSLFTWMIYVFMSFLYSMSSLPEYFIICFRKSRFPEVFPIMFFSTFALNIYYYGSIYRFVDYLQTRD